MSEFFNYQSPYRTNIFLDLNLYERIIPLIGIAIIIYFIYKYRESFRSNKNLDKRFRYTMAIVLFLLYSSHYILRFVLYGFDTIILPFHLCGIAMAFAIFLLFTNNKAIYSFVLMTGVLGSIISFINPIIGYDSSYYRYYQFFFAHGILFITPLYYFIVYKWYPGKKDLLKGYWILQALALFMIIFNYFMGTDFMFMFIDPDKLEKFPMIQYLGGIPYYILVAEVVVGLYFIGSYILFRYLNTKEQNVPLEGGVYENN
jgi:hypothetical integral membrane protein (TIGR02206 family)